jgi:hypothetical protein
MGMAPAAEDGSSSLMDLQLLLALQSATLLEKEVGSHDYAVLYDKLSQELITTIQHKYWDDSRMLYADTPGKDKFSQHANSLAILAGLVEGSKARKVGELLMADETLAPASIYFKYYLHLALSKAGFGNHYLDWLDIWRKNIDLGMTTWGETSEVETTRSDNHAWGSSPNIEFFRIILGIESAAPYFSKVNIEPHLGTISNIAGEMPHPAGIISVSYNNSANKLKAEINLPEKITGTFVWKGKNYVLKSGNNKFEL